MLYNCAHLHNLELATLLFRDKKKQAGGLCSARHGDLWFPGFYLLIFFYLSDVFDDPMWCPVYLQKRTPSEALKARPFLTAEIFLTFYETALLL
jgi:hypothetical protein